MPLQRMLLGCIIVCVYYVFDGFTRHLSTSTQPQISIVWLTLQTISRASVQAFNIVSICSYPKMCFLYLLHKTYQIYSYIKLDLSQHNTCLSNQICCVYFHKNRFFNNNFLINSAKWSLPKIVISTKVFIRYKYLMTTQYLFQVVSWSWRLYIPK